MSNLCHKFRYIISTLLLRPNNVIHRALYTVSCPINNVWRNSLFKSKYTNDFFINFRTLIIHEFKSAKIKDIDASKTRLIKELNLSEKDAEPFYKLPLRSLLQIYKTTKNDDRNGFCKNRLYYISEKIKCPSSTLSEQIVKRIFIYKLSFDWLESSLNVLLAMNVPGDRILRDLWVLKYHHNTIQERLLRVRNLGVENLYPWMVRCSEDILSRSIQISQETKTILGENKSTKMYLANRLDTTPDIIEDMYVKIPALKTIRVTKAKNFLDFLINEGFTVEDIVDKPRIFAASQKTVKRRLEKLRTLGLSEINLNVLCRSKKGFQRYFESIESIIKEQE